MGGGDPRLPLLPAGVRAEPCGDPSGTGPWITGGEDRDAVEGITGGEIRLSGTGGITDGERMSSGPSTSIWERRGCGRSAD